MLSLTVLLLTLASSVLNVSGASLPGTPMSPSRRLHYEVPRTLQELAPVGKEGLASRNELDKRQSSCTGGENCIDGGCCPAGYQCVGAFTANSGCCRIGQTCSGPPVGCAVAGHVVCPGTDGCCATLAQCPVNGSQVCGTGGSTPPPTTYAPPPTTYTPPTNTYTPPAVTYTPPATQAVPTTTTPQNQNTVTVAGGVQPTGVRSGSGAVRVGMAGVMAIMMCALAVLA